MSREKMQQTTEKISAMSQ